MLFLVRIVLVSINIILAGSLAIIVCLLRPFHPNNAWLSVQFIRHIAGLKTMGINLIVENKAALTANRPCVFIMNHQENLDFFTAIDLTPPKTVSIGKKSLKFIPFFGQFYWLSGNILIDRQRARKAYKSMDLASKKLKERDTSIWVFPEGTRNRGKGLKRFKKGPFYLAIKAQVPIVPVCISSYKGRIDLNKWKAGTIHARILDPIETKNMDIATADQLASNCFDLMKENIEQIDQKFS